MSLKKDIKKIEAYDVSHISGDHAVASCVSFFKSRPSVKKNIELLIFQRNYQEMMLVH
jgi:excinuclease UvrABC nuclease subunit